MSQISVFCCCALSCQTFAEIKTDMSCGPSTISMAARLLGRNVSRSELLKATDEADLLRSFSMVDLEGAADRLGLFTAKVGLDPAAPLCLDIPLIVAIDRKTAGSGENHFVILFGRRNESIQVIDYPYPSRFVRVDELKRVWDG